MENIDHLISAKWIITCEENNRILEDYAFAIKNGKIIDLLPIKEIEKKYQADVKTDYPHHAIMPGFINSHTHLPMNFFRGLADDLDLMDWLANHIWPAETKWLSREFVYDASLYAMAEMIRGGTTCFNDMYFFMNATADAAKQSGMRAHIGLHLIDVPTAWAKTVEESIDKAIEFYHQYNNVALITPTIAPHSTYTLSRETLLKAKELADQYQLKMNIHLQESAEEMKLSLVKNNQYPLAYIDELGLVTPDLIAIHMTQITPQDYEILQDKKPSLVHCPESNMKLTSGNCPVERLFELGINVALGTDGAASNNDLDMMGEMRTAAFVGKIASQNPKALTAERTLKLATLNGAKALGIHAITGSITPGKSADFIAIDLDHIETQPLYNVISQIVYAASRHQVTDTWVAGKQLMKDRRLLTLDENELLNKAKMWRKKIKS